MADETTYPDNPEELGPYWRDQLDHAKKVFEIWGKRGDKVVERYRDERDAVERLRSKFNILWSNVQVISPSLYGRPAKPEVSRRYMDQDPVGRLASTILERVLDYEIEQFPDFGAAMAGCVEDRLLPGRGTAWIRYAPVISTQTMEAPEGVETTNTEPMTVETIDSAHSPIDYVYWKDFLHSPARTWDEVWWVARWVYMDEKEGIKRFGNVFKSVPLAHDNADDDQKKTEKSKANVQKKAKVAEIWNKRTGRVCWVAEGYRQTLDERDDPLQLEGFFPCPEPLFATTTTGTLIPVPDYVEYQDQAQELDSITARITFLVKAVKAVGVFNAEYKELARLLTEGIDNKLFPVTNWASLAEKGGLEGAVSMLDLTTVIQALGVLYKAREDVKQTIYEICGISDILRGASNAQETLGAQQLKANFGSLRLKKSQMDVARFATDIFKLKAQVICKFYPPELIVQMSGIQRTSDGQDPMALQQAIQMLQNSTIRDFSIQVESDSLAQIDEQAEKEAASEAIGAIGGFLKEALPMVQQAPETLQMTSEMLLFLVRRYRAGRGLESAIERSMKMLEQKAQMAAQNPQPTPEEIQAKAQMQADQMRVQADVAAAQQKAQFDAQVQQSKLQAEMQLEQMKAQQRSQEVQLEAKAKLAEINATRQVDQWMAQLDASVKIRIAEMDNAAKLQTVELQNRTALQSAQISADSAQTVASMAPPPAPATPSPQPQPSMPMSMPMPAMSGMPGQMPMDSALALRQPSMPSLGSLSQGDCGPVTVEPTPVTIHIVPAKLIRRKAVRNEEGIITEIIDVDATTGESETDEFPTMERTGDNLVVEQPRAAKRYKVLRDANGRISEVVEVEPEEVAAE